jgi:SOS response regulatory protein OraA/RecX
VRQGYGFVRIQKELENLQIDDGLVADALHGSQVNWLDCAIAVKNKKFPQDDHLSFAIMQKQKKFLYYRGFPVDVINLVFKNIKLYDNENFRN